MIASLIALPFLALAKADLVEDCTRTAVVVEGDTCDSLSAQYGVSTFQFALVNSAEVDSSCSNLQIDQTVCLGTAGNDCTKTYRVVADDTCGWIQEMYGMDKETLYSNNPQINDDCTNIYIGEVLCVDTQAYEYPEYDQDLYDAVAETYLPFCDEL